VSLPPQLFCDTSFFFASIDPRDKNFQRASALNGEILASGVQLFTTWDIISETVTLLRYRCSFSGAMSFLEEVKPFLGLVEHGEGVRAEAEDVFRSYGQEHQLSYCDVISFVVITTFLEFMPCLTFDADFRRMGLTVID
jgi:predicted nucleic acid-binding protein